MDFLDKFRFTSPESHLCTAERKEKQYKKPNKRPKHPTKAREEIQNDGSGFL
jgi:hypothetical protein